MGLDGVEIVMEVEDTFDINIPDEDAAEAITVGNLVDVVEKITKAKGKLNSNGKPWSRVEIIEGVKEAVVKILGPVEINLKDRFVDDLGVD